MSLYYNSLQHIHYLVLPRSFVNSFAQSQLPHQNISSLGVMSLSLFLPYIPMKVKVTQSCPTLCDPMDYTVLQSMGSTILFSRPEYWSGQPFRSPGELPNPGFEPRSPTLQVDSLPAELPGKPIYIPIHQKNSYLIGTQVFTKRINVIQKNIHRPDYIYIIPSHPHNNPSR